MAARHDFECSHCGDIFEDMPLYVENTQCPCGGTFEIHWSRPSQNAQVHAKERSVVWRNPATGEIAYPPRNDVAMPERYRQRGFERHELPSLKSVEHFEKTQHVRNEKAWMDRNGREL